MTCIDTSNKCHTFHPPVHHTSYKHIKLVLTRNHITWAHCSTLCVANPTWHFITWLETANNGYCHLIKISNELWSDDKNILTSNPLYLLCHYIYLLRVGARAVLTMLILRHEGRPQTWADLWQCHYWFCRPHIALYSTYFLSCCFPSSPKCAVDIL